VGQEREESPNRRNDYSEITEDRYLPNFAKIKEKNEPIGIIYIVTVQRFKGCILITICHFVNVLYGKTDRFHIPTNLENGIWQLYAKPNIFYEDFGSSILSFSLTLNPEPGRVEHVTFEVCFSGTGEG